MARGEFVENAIWEELEPLSQDAAMLYIWSFTNSRCNMAGLYKVSERSMLECKVPAKRLSNALAELEERRFAFYRAPWLWVKGRVSRHRSTHPNFARSIAKDVGQLKSDHELRVTFLERYGSYGWLAEFLEPLALESQKSKGLARVWQGSTDTLARVSDAVAYKEVPLTTEDQSDARALCDLLAGLVERNGSKRPEVTKGWLDSARLLLDRDGRSLEEARRLIEWCQADEFWRSNVLSMPTFRKQYDRLRLRATGSPAEATTGQNVLPLDRRCRRCKVRDVRAGYGAYCEQCSEELAS